MKVWYVKDIWVEGLREITKNLSQDRRYSGRDLSPILPEYEVGVLKNRPLRLVKANSARYVYVK